MEIVKTEDELRKYLENNLARYYESKSLIPFLGAGFTKGCQTKRKIVPDGNQCAKMMKEMIVCQPSVDTSAKEEIDNLTDFDKIANYFYRLVPKDVIKEFISENFTSVRLNDCRKKFVNFEWPYIYTLNIDDAIERSTGRQIVLPNNKINKKYLDGVLFKLHGDANDEVTYIRDRDGIIFSRKQYLQSLTENKDLLLIFLEDYFTYNFIFIGCSLDNEIDLEYILANNKTSSPTQTDKIYVTSTVPTPLKRMTLEDFGFNVCIVVENYLKFYEQVTETLSLIEIDDEDIFSKYQINEVALNIETEFNKRIICGDEEIVVTKNKVTLPSFFTHRDLTDNVVNILKKESLLFIVGRRMSGKTFLAYDLIKTLRNEKVYLIPSNVSFDSNLIDRIFELSNAIIVFDTDTILASDIEDIYYKAPISKQKNIRFVFMINSSDRLMVSVPYTRAIDSDILEISNLFSNNEIFHVNYELSKLGLVNFKQNWNILSNIVNYKIIYRRMVQELARITVEVDTRSLQIFILNAVFDKVYSSLFRALRIDYDILKYTSDASNKCLEFEFGMEAIERGQHSNYKLITNSKSFIFSILGAYIYKNPSNMSASANAIISIVSTLRNYDSFRNYWKNLISFDNLNQIFYHRKTGGAIKLIFTIYERLESILFEDNHYWLQRGKSIYYLNRNDLQDLQKAIEYSKKPYFDSQDHTRIKITSSFQIAMIYNRIAALQNFLNSENVKETVNWYAISLKENEHNVKIVNNFLGEARTKKGKSDFYRLCTWILQNPMSVDKEKREFLLSKLFGTGFSSFK